MNGTNLTHTQIIAIGVAALFGIPICIGLVVWRLFGFWSGLVSGVLVLLLIIYLAQRWAKRTSKQEKPK